MTKVVSIILIICAIAGGVYFTKKNLKEDVSKGSPIAAASIVVTKTNGIVDFYPTHYGPTLVVPITYNLDMSKEDKNYVPKQAPKLKVTCPAGVNALIPNDYSTEQVDVCGKEVAMTKNDKFAAVNKYEVKLNFINSGKENKKVSSEVTVNGTTVKGRDWTIPPAYTEASLGLTR